MVKYARPRSLSGTANWACLLNQNNKQTSQEKDVYILASKDLLMATANVVHNLFVGVVSICLHHMCHLCIFDTMLLALGF